MTPHVYYLQIGLLYTCFIPISSLFGETDVQCIDHKHIDYVGNGFTIGFMLNCTDETILLHVQYDDYDLNWFGIVFNDAMLPSYAAIFTVGKATETQRAETVYIYYLEGKDINSAIYQPHMDWSIINQTIDTGNNRIEYFYETHLNNTLWSIPVTDITFRYAFGTSLTLQKHVTVSNIITYDMKKETKSITKTNRIRLHVIHGVIMWLAWSLFAPIGILSSRFRKIIEKHLTQKNIHITWFNVHKTVQSLVVLLTVSAFLIAVYFQETHHGLQFDSTHKILGLTVVIITVLQPFNAIVRPHAVKPGETKSIGRFCWEIFHKTSGYCAWIIGLINSFFALHKHNVQQWKFYICIWILCLIFCYCCLWIYDYIVRKKEKNVENKPLLDTSQSNRCYTENVKEDDSL